LRARRSAASPAAPLHAIEDGDLAGGAIDDAHGIAAPKALCPELVKAAIAGRLPRWSVGISCFHDLPASWRKQFRQLGIAAPPAD